MRVTSFRPVQVGENGFIVTDNGVMGKGTHKLKFDSSFPVSVRPEGVEKSTLISPESDVIFNV